jgi:hypothetical protein
VKVASILLVPGDGDRGRASPTLLLERHCRTPGYRRGGE